MKELDVKYRGDIDYRELFNVMIDTNVCEDTAVGITKTGELLYIENKLMNNSSAYWVQSIFYSIDRDEFCEFMKQAESKGYLEKAILAGQTTLEELRTLSE